MKLSQKGKTAVSVENMHLMKVNGLIIVVCLTSRRFNYGNPQFADFIWSVADTWVHLPLLLLLRWPCLPGRPLFSSRFSGITAASLSFAACMVGLHSHTHTYSEDNEFSAQLVQMEAQRAVHHWPHSHPSKRSRLHLHLAGIWTLQGRSVVPLIWTISGPDYWCVPCALHCAAFIMHFTCSRSCF